MRALRRTGGKVFQAEASQGKDHVLGFLEEEQALKAMEHGSEGKRAARREEGPDVMIPWGPEADMDFGFPQRAPGSPCRL